MNIAFIPVRGGSKSIPLKNIRKIAGHPLVYWTTKAASECKQIDKVYVATDSDIIKTVVEEFKLDKVEVIGRSADTASDTATTESAMLEFAEQYTFDNIVLVQATSPLIQAEDLERGFDIFKQQDTDSVLSVVRQKRFHWAVDKKGLAQPIMMCSTAREDRNLMAILLKMVHSILQGEKNCWKAETGYLGIYVSAKWTSLHILKSMNRVIGP